MTQFRRAKCIAQHLSPHFLPPFLSLFYFIEITDRETAGDATGFGEGRGAEVVTHTQRSPSRGFKRQSNGRESQRIMLIYFTVVIFVLVWFNKSECVCVCLFF